MFLHLRCVSTQIDVHRRVTFSQADFFLHTTICSWHDASSLFKSLLEWLYVPPCLRVYFATDSAHPCRVCIGLHVFEQLISANLKEVTAPSASNKASSGRTGGTGKTPAASSKPKVASRSSKPTPSTNTAAKPKTTRNTGAGASKETNGKVQKSGAGAGAGAGARNVRGGTNKGQKSLQEKKKGKDGASSSTSLKNWSRHG